MTSAAKDDDALLRGRRAGRAERQKEVRALYEHAPYPDLGAGLKDPTHSFAAIIDALAGRANVTFLEAGCGTGHMLVGVAKRFPGWECHGLDLSQASLDVARQLADMHGASVELHRLSYLERLPFKPGSLDLISAQGTIHHCDDPVGALKNLRRYLAPDGYISMHVYGARLDARKFDMKETISLFVPDLSEFENRFAVYDALVRHRSARDRVRTILDTSPLDVLRWLRQAGANLRRRAKSTVWSPPWTHRFGAPTAPWADHFCHPCERAYEVPGIRDLVEGANLEVVAMLDQGRIDSSLVPEPLREQFETLPPWDQWRFMELMGPARSFSVILRKPGAA